MFFRPRRQYGYGGGGQRADIFTLMMAWGLFQRIQSLPYKPPVTLGLMALMGFIHFFPNEVPFLSSSELNAFVPVLILANHEFHRFWISTLLHANHSHLYYNMTSFLYKGVVLESSLGSEMFALVTALSLVVSQFIFLALSLYVAPMFGFPDAPHVRTLGFSGVIFALKVLVNSAGVADRNILGLAHIFGLNM